MVKRKSSGLETALMLLSCGSPSESPLPQTGHRSIPSSMSSGLERPLQYTVSSNSKGKAETSQ